MDSQPKDNFGDGFRHRRHPAVVEAFAADPRNPAETGARFVPRPSVDVEVNELAEIHDPGRPSQWHGSDAESSSGFSRISNHHLELKRPDSVITTSSIMSSSDTASQAGDSSSIEVPPSVYAISGLYGPISAKPHNRHHSDVSGAVCEPQPTFVSHLHSASAAPVPRRTSDDVHGNPISGANLVSGAPSAFLLPQHPVGKQILTHRRQTSHPAVLQNTSASAVPPAVAAACRTLPQQHTSVSRHASNPVGQPAIQAASAVASGSQVKGHKRSHSYGYHRNPPMFQHGHRRTGSSVIETLQTLACNGTTEQELNPHESILQFLENLRKEQQEK
jgi:hypothetical protein